MSEASQPVEPDLHAIFGMEGEQQSAVSVEGAGDGSLREAGEPGTESFDPFADDGGPAVEFDVDPSVEAPEESREGAEEEEQPAAPAGNAEQGWTGITQPSRRGVPARFLTDVIVEMHLASPKREVDDAIETARTAGHHARADADRAGRRSRQDRPGPRAGRALRPRPSRPRRCSRSTWPRRTLISAAAAKRYEAVPVAFVEEQDAAGGHGRPRATCSRSTTSRS